MNKYGKHGEAAERSAERRRREDEAPRLRNEVPTLRSLRLELEFRRGGDGGGSTEQAYVRHVVIERAPALFIVPCSERECQDGGHDITRDVLGALRERRTEFTGTDTCFGRVGPSACGRVLHYLARAAFIS